MQHIDGLDGHEQHEGHDEEVDDGVEKSTDADANIADLDDDIRGGPGVEEQTDDGGDDVVFIRELITAVKAEPTTTPTAMSSTLPRMAKALNSSKKFLMPLVFCMMCTALFAADGMLYLYNTRRRQCFQVRPDALRSTGSSAGRWP